jgi:hypothetical protein
MHAMDDRLRVPLQLVGWLYVVTGVTMLVAPLFAFRGAGVLAGAGLLLPLGAAVSAAGVGLLRRARWAWWWTLLIAGSGAIVTAARLWAGGPWSGLGPVLITNLLTLTVLLMARTAFADAGVARGRRRMEGSR